MSLITQLRDWILHELGGQCDPKTTVYLEHLEKTLDLIEAKIDAKFAELEGMIKAITIPAP